MAPEGEAGAGIGGEEEAGGPGGLATGTTDAKGQLCTTTFCEASLVLPVKEWVAASMSGMTWRHCALPNVSEYAEEQDLRDMFSRFGHVTRVFLAKDRETQRAKGFAFVSFADRSDAAIACGKMDGCKCHQLYEWEPQLTSYSDGYNNLILRVEFAKKAS